MSIGWAQTFALDLDQARKALALYANEPGASLQNVSSQLGAGIPKVEGLNAWLKYLGLRDPKARRLTTLGELVYRFDPGLQNIGTLHALHYLLVSNPDATIWYESVNYFLSQRDSFTRESLQEYFQTKGIGHNTAKQLKSDLGLFTQTYTDTNRRALQVLDFLQIQGELIVVRNVSDIHPLILGFCLFHRLESGSRESTTSISRLLNEAGTPGPVFHLPVDVLRHKLATLESIGYIAVVHMADIDGISYAFQGPALDLLSQYYRTPNGPTLASI